jgi:hypothetical protein
MKFGFSFAFDPPVGWAEFKEGSALVFRGPRNEELLVSANSVAGAGTSDGFQNLLARMTRNAIDTMKETVEEAGLTVTLPLQRGFNGAGLEVWEIHARTADGLTLFCQATIVAADGVMLATLETPEVDSGDREFGRFVNGVSATPTMSQG